MFAIAAQVLVSDRNENIEGGYVKLESQLLEVDIKNEVVTASFTEFCSFGSI